VDKYIVNKKEVVEGYAHTYLTFAAVDDSHIVVLVNGYNSWPNVNEVCYYSLISQSGWVKGSNNKWYYYNPKTGIMTKGWLLYNNKWYFFNTNGEMVTGWLYYNNKWYFLGSAGDMKTGWIKYGSNWYYLDGKGVMKTGWIMSGNKWYYLYNDGRMAFSTIIDGKYRLGPDGEWIP
jgi:glucan-binding YG repeat protein